MTTIKTYCTIVNMLSKLDMWYMDPSLSEEERTPWSVGAWYWDPGETTVPSGWDESSVFTVLKGANEYLRPAKVNFELAGKVNVITMWPRIKSGVVDEIDFKAIAGRIGAQCFKRGEARLAFIKKFAGALYRGRSIQSWCYSCVERPDMATRVAGPNLAQARWTLAHELGHLLGLGHDESNTTRMMRS